MKKVLFVVRGDATVPSCRFRAYQFEAPLAAVGVEADYFVEGRNESALGWVTTTLKLIRRVARGGYDAVVYQKRLQRERVTLMRALHPNVWFDFDDAVYLSNPGRFAATLRACSGVIAGNQELASHAAPHHPRVEIIPTTVEIPERYTPPPPGEALRVSWVGTGGNLQYLEPVFEAIERGRANGMKAILHVLTDEPGRVPERPGVVVEAWSRRAEEAAMVGCHVGVMPLLDDAWTRGKCACKALQYLSYGRPVVSSPVGVNRALFENSRFGRLATDADEWAGALSDWDRSRSELEAAGLAGREFVQAHFDVRVWAEALKSTLLGPPEARAS